jgi:lipopolysaccharide export LptBFGC system permease protein LptF
MSLNFTQIKNSIDRKVKSNNISYPVEEKTEDINESLDFIYATIFEVGGKWQFDDTNHSDYPIISTSLVSGQRDYTFTSDQQGNLILDIYKVMVKDENGTFIEIYPVDQQSDEYTQGFWNGLNQTGIPTRYDKTANGIFLDAIPSYDSINGLKVFINREGSYFQTSDTTKKPGFAGLFHEYLALRPAYKYAQANSLKNEKSLLSDLLTVEGKIKKYYRDRTKDEVVILTTEKVNSI